MSDLIERLREVQGNVTKSYRNPEGPEAADEIERLTAENKRLTEIVRIAKRHVKICPVHTGGEPNALAQALAALEETP